MIIILIGNKGIRTLVANKNAPVAPTDSTGANEA